MMPSPNEPAPVLPMLFSWQEPFRDFFGRNVKVVLYNGTPRFGKLEIPRRKMGGIPPRRALLLVLRSDHRLMLRIELIDHVELREVPT